MQYSWLAPLALLALAVAPRVDAQAESAYYGVSLGNFDYREDDQFGGEGIADQTRSYRLMVGYQFMEHLGVEGGYGKTGSIRDTVTFDLFPTGTVDLAFRGKFQMFTVRLVGVLPFDNGVSLLGGIGYSDVKFDFELSDGVDTVSDDTTTNEPGYYIGAQYNWDRVAVRLGYEKFDFGGGIDVSETMLSFFYKL